MPACARPFGYVPRQTHECDAAVLVRRHLAEFLGRCEERAGPLPAFVKAEPWGFAGLRRLRARLRADLLPQLGRRAAGAVFVQVARLLPLVHGPADGRGGGVAGGPRTAGGGLPAVGAVVPGPDGGAAGLRRAAAGRNRRAAGAGGDAGHAARREATARPGLGRGLARGRGHCRPALPQRPRPLCTPALPRHRRRVRGAGRRRAAFPGRRTADAGAHDGRARAGPRGHPRRRRRPRHRPCAGRLPAALARRPAPRARLTVRAAADDALCLRHESPRRDHRRRPRAASSSSESAATSCARPSPTTPSRRSPAAASASRSRRPGAAAPLTPTWTPTSSSPASAPWSRRPAST
jgi:hypothetical protein